MILVIGVLSIQPFSVISFLPLYTSFGGGFVFAPRKDIFLVGKYVVDKCRLNGFMSDSST